ncbi:ATP-dependent Clp protease ATP-binding subunit ClpA [bacterium]|nr:ATP-dependent Clp protease ATP-binding subunit ClpA [bacterium]
MCYGGRIVFSTELGYTLEAAWREASTRLHAYFTLEHLLLALLADPEVHKILKNCGATLQELKADLEEFLESHVETATGSSAERAEPVQTPAVQRVLQRAILHMHSSGKQFITASEVLVATFSENDSHAVFFLRKQGLERIHILDYISHGIARDTDSDPRYEEDDRYSEDEYIDEYSTDGDFYHDAPEARRRSALETYTENLSHAAESGELDPVIGREAEVERAIRILSRRQKNNPLFLGAPGVGKTAMAHAIALQILSGQIPEALRNAQVYSLHIGSLIAGTKFRGEFEDRIRNITRELLEQDNAILFIDEIHTIVGAGSTGTGSVDASNFLKPLLSKGTFRCIGSTTDEDYKKFFEKDRALTRRFTTIELEEPSSETTVKILEGLKERFEEHHAVKFSRSALRAAVELSAKHITDKALPDKAIDVLDEAGAANSIRLPSKRKKQITDTDIADVVSRIAKVPVKKLKGTDEQKLQDLEHTLKSKVFGQDDAIHAIVLAMKRARALLQSEAKPMGSFLFAGPTGVGKTELAKVLAQALGIHFHRFDMSEYMEKHAISRLLGAPPGYVGYEEGGQLTDLVRKHPYAVLLLDEIEKAHPDIFNVLLQVMDNAQATDNQGRKADFRNIILIMTTNAGSTAAKGIGFGKQESNDHREKAIKELFRPEFRNRLDDTIHFHSLPLPVVRSVVQKCIDELESQLSSQKVLFTLSPEALDWLAKHGFDEELGARPMARIIQKEIKDQLVDELLFGELRKGGTVLVDEKEGALVLSIQKGS